MMAVNFSMNPQPDGNRLAWARFPARAGARGFSLVEVVLAIGVIAFGIVALIGILAFSTGLSRSSDQDTIIAAMSRQVTSELRNTAFASLPPTGTFWYFDGEGRRLAVKAKAIYQCQINLTADDAYKSANNTPNLYQVRLVFTSALAATPAPGTTPAPGSPSAPLLTATTALPRND